MEIINLQRRDEELPYIYKTMAVDCYLPSILSPLTHPENIFHYTSAMLSYPIDWLEIHLTVIHKYTFKSVTISPFFLPRVECTLGNLKQFRNQIWEPRDKQEPNTTERLRILTESNIINPERILDPEYFIKNISCSF
ncbi:uncharacterized protein BO88DRAFT_429986 [Aspergillus vadensis CBS 113365]|uniref:Uncharacterized protein n=1 Tax=Aspergillus vadensis (strain CBS 113365 / IMI 142717 / IBT 24658) TaxID=1448311 RepID=A0A319AX55_ASPVC|nr:hypothetical protein BO88DRAFT_429986 [Aspergillus vadensis CBS 113365]PYH63971.1 hypothetical protein BO88DRAFT_429986 [Aspergillus vadensis CBS 113365]